jgi:hypothetical protein
LFAAASSESATEGKNRFVRVALDESGASVTATDWTGFPVRVADCLTRERALRVLDERGRTVDGGGRGLQEEYVEWRARRRDGVVDRVELTTELPDYWRILAGHHPERVLELVSEFAAERAPVVEVFGSCDPFGSGISPDDREHAFAQTMLGPGGNSPYNDGRRAICCMVRARTT